jgi:hypothetical protein
VADFSSTVIFWPVDVVIVNVDLDTLSTVPKAPPCAGADRTLDAPPLVPLPSAEALGGATGLADADEVEARLAETPVTAHINPAVATHLLLLFASDR